MRKFTKLEILISGEDDFHLVLSLVGALIGISRGESLGGNSSKLGEYRFKVRGTPINGFDLKKLKELL